MVGTFEKKQVNERGLPVKTGNARAGQLFSRLIKNAKKHGVTIVYNEKGKAKKLIISPGKWAPITFKVYIKDDRLMIYEKNWGVQDCEILIPNIND